MEYVTIQGTTVPALGFGTWMLDGDECTNAVTAALDIGYRHIDTAQIYGNEAEVGTAIERSSMDRDELFVTTKVWNDHLAPDKVRSTTEQSLRDLRTDYVDLLLIHWPYDMDGLPATFEALRALQGEGKARHLGVSNFTPSQVERAREQATIFCNQVEYHPYLSQDDLLAQARKHDHLLTAYSPLARGEIFGDPTLAEIADDCDKSTAQVVLRWLLDQDHVAVVPKATSREHIAANFEVFDFSLTDEQHQLIAALNRDYRIIDPPFVSDWER